MKYIYYSLYQFYTKVIRVQKYYAPIINVAGVIAALELFLVFGLINIFVYIRSGVDLIPYHPIIPTGVFIGLYWLNYKYYLDKEKLIVKDLNKLSLGNKILSYLFTFLLVVTLVWIYLFDGLYYFIKS